MSSPSARVGPITGTAPIRAAVLVLVLATTLLGACGIPTDDRPRLLADDGSQTSEPRPVDVVSGDAATLYFSSPGSEALVAVDRGIDADPTIERALEQLLLGPTEEDEDDGLITAIPIDTTLVGLDITEQGLLTIDLSEQWERQQAPGTTTAYAQVVLTATEFDEVRSVRFMVNGELVDDVPTDPPTEGTGSEVTRANYIALDPG